MTKKKSQGKDQQQHKHNQGKLMFLADICLTPPLSGGRQLQHVDMCNTSAVLYKMLTRAFKP